MSVPAPSKGHGSSFLKLDSFQTFLFLISAVPGMEPRTLGVVDTHAAMEPHPQSSELKDNGVEHEGRGRWSQGQVAAESPLSQGPWILLDNL